MKVYIYVRIGRLHTYIRNFGYLHVFDSVMFSGVQAKEKDTILVKAFEKLLNIANN